MKGLSPWQTAEPVRTFASMAAGPLPTLQVTERAVSILAVGALLAFLYLAREFLLPSVLGAFVALTVHPVVQVLVRRFRAPRSIAAMFGTVLALAMFVLILVILFHQLVSLANELPGYEDRIRGAWQSVSQKFLKLQQSGESLVPRHPRQVRTVEGVAWEKLAFGTAMGLLAILGQATLAIFVVYFILAESGNYRRKLVRLFRHQPEGEDKVLTMIEQIHRDVERYMLNRVVLNAILGVVTGVAFALYGLEHAAIWGLTTALLHFIPYVGPAAGLVLPVLMAVLQYDGWKDPVLVGLIYTVLVGLQGNLVDPIFLGKQLRLNSLAIFLGSIFWFWFWGPLGLFLAVPILSVLRIVSAHTPRLKWLGEFLAA
jgi:predicted PurR-regulated permease PerM